MQHLLKPIGIQKYKNKKMKLIDLFNGNITDSDKIYLASLIGVNKSELSLCAFKFLHQYNDDGKSSEYIEYVKNQGLNEIKTKIFLSKLINDDVGMGYLGGYTKNQINIIRTTNIDEIYTIILSQLMELNNGNPTKTKILYGIDLYTEEVDDEDTLSIFNLNFSIDYGDEIDDDDEKEIESLGGEMFCLNKLIDILPINNKIYDLSDITAHIHTDDFDVEARYAYEGLPRLKLLPGENISNFNGFDFDNLEYGDIYILEINKNEYIIQFSLNRCLFTLIDNSF